MIALKRPNKTPAMFEFSGLIPELVNRGLRKGFVTKLAYQPFVGG